MCKLSIASCVAFDLSGDATTSVTSIAPLLTARSLYRAGNSALPHGEHDSGPSLDSHIRLTLCESTHTLDRVA